MQERKTVVAVMGIMLSAGALVGPARAQATGACCRESGACEETTQENCGGANESFSIPGSCSPTKTCLKKDGTFIETTEDCCDHIDGTVRENRVDKVYAFNGGAIDAAHPLGAGHDNGFTNAAHAWVFVQLGLLSTDGSRSPPTLDGDELKQGDDVVGRVIRDENNNIIGYENADGTRVAYNVDVATTKDAWNSVGNGGELVIAKHGITPTGITGDGGGISLDGGHSYGGFKTEGSADTGTGVVFRHPGGGAYELPARPGAGISVYANGCHTEDDPDGEDGPQKSVVESLKSVNGVGKKCSGGENDKDPCNDPEDCPGGECKHLVRGNSGMINKGLRVNLNATGADWADKIERAKKKLNDLSKAFFEDKDEKGDYVDWILAHPFPEQHELVKNALDSIDVTFTLTYSKGCTAGEPGCYYLPVTGVDEEGGELVYQINEDFFPIELTIPPGSLYVLTPVFLRPIFVADLQLPAETEPATYFAKVSTYGGDQTLMFEEPATLVLYFPPGDDIVGFFEVAPDGTLTPYTADIDSPTGQVTANIFTDGTFVALKKVEAIPTVSEWGLAIMALLLLTGLKIKFGRRRSAQA